MVKDNKEAALKILMSKTRKKSIWGTGTRHRPLPPQGERESRTCTNARQRMVSIINVIFNTDFCVPQRREVEVFCKI